jgi:hypothetical protein
MTRQDTLASLQLLLEYARDELNTVGLRDAATLADDAVAIVRADLETAEPEKGATPPEPPVPLGKPRLVFNRRSGGGTRGGQ